MLKFKTHINNKNKQWITFIHGFGGSSNIWHKQVRELSQHHNLLFIDLRGHGKSRNICLESDFDLVNSCFSQSWPAVPNTKPFPTQRPSRPC